MVQHGSGHGVTRMEGWKSAFQEVESTLGLMYIVGPRTFGALPEPGCVQPGSARSGLEVCICNATLNADAHLQRGV